MFEDKNEIDYLRLKVKEYEELIQKGLDLLEQPVITTVNRQKNVEEYKFLLKQNGIETNDRTSN
jgi:hypothetical protein